jgi:hypothetical protein
LEQMMTISKKLLAAAAMMASLNMGAFSPAHAVESATVPHASAHHKTTHHGGTARHETARAPNASATECWHNTDPDRGASRGYGFMGPGPC